MARVFLFLIINNIFQNFWIIINKSSAAYHNGLRHKSLVPYLHLIKLELGTKILNITQDNIGSKTELQLYFI